MSVDNKNNPVMKVICVKEDLRDHLFAEAFTIGKVYEVLIISTFHDEYYLRNDMGYEGWFRADSFKTISQIRQDKLAQLI
jgi:hypothetical protein